MLKSPPERIPEVIFSYPFINVTGHGNFHKLGYYQSSPHKLQGESAVEEAKGSALESAKSFVAGGFGGVAAVLVGLKLVWFSIFVTHLLSGHPFDLTKTRLQTASAGTYTGGLDVVKKTLARDGVTGYALPGGVCIMKAHELI
jgi:hypothetical protein